MACKSLKRQLKDDHQSFRLPTRLVEITRGVEGKISVRLCETESMDSKALYTTLSHCWGRGAHQSLTSTNYQEYGRCIPSGALSRTFLDAIRITDDLGIRYLWIDAMCIIQDSHDDWVREASLMAAVYSNSYLNLAATSAVDGSGGLIHPAYNPLCLAHCIIEPSWTGLPQGPYILSIDRALHRRHVENAPLNRRAWVLQERLLAPRTVQFTHVQMWWVCRSRQATSVSPHGLPEPLRMDQLEFHTRMRFTRLREPGESRNDEWADIIEKFTKCQLTQSQDKLVALAGIAKAAQLLMELPESDYMAGLWKAMFPNCLLWKPYRGRTTRAQSYRAPTWSWASVDGHVHYGLHIVDSCAVTLIDCCVKTESGGPFGPVVSASMRLTGPLYSASLQDFHEVHGDKHVYTRVTIECDTATKESYEINELSIQLDEAPGIQRRDKRATRSCFLLLLVSEENQTSFLALERVLEAPGCYCRIGIVIIAERPTLEKDIKHLRGMLGPTDYEADFGNGIYQISII